MISFYLATGSARHQRGHEKYPSVAADPAFRLAFGFQAQWAGRLNAAVRQEGRRMGRAVSEDEVIASLIGPRRPLDHCLLFLGSPCWYAPNVGLLVSFRFHDPDLDEACRGWLCRRGWSCRSREELDAHAARMGWEEWPPKFRFAASAGSAVAGPSSTGSTSVSVE